MKDVDCNLIKEITTANTLLYITSKDHHLPCDLKEVLKMAINSFDSNRWDMHGVNCYTVNHGVANVDYLKQIWEIFQQIEFSMCLYNVYTPVLDARDDLEETASPCV